MSTTFVFPVFGDSTGDHGFKINSAARNASRRWAKALLGGDALGLGRADYALALFDKVDEMNRHIRAVSQKRTLSRTTEAWLDVLNTLLEMAHRMHLSTHQYPELESILTKNLASDIRQFVLGAMGCVWTREIDSVGRPPQLRSYDHAWADKYIPPPEFLPPRPFTIANIANPNAEPDVVWLDHNFEEVPAPVRYMAMPYMDGGKWVKGSTEGEEDVRDE